MVLRQTRKSLGRKSVRPNRRSTRVKLDQDSFSRHARSGARRDMGSWNKSGYGIRSDKDGLCQTVSGQCLLRECVIDCQAFLFYFYFFERMQDPPDTVMLFRQPTKGRWVQAPCRKRKPCQKIKKIKRANQDQKDRECSNV